MLTDGHGNLLPLTFAGVMESLEDFESEQVILSDSDHGSITVIARRLTGQYPECPHVVFKAQPKGITGFVECETLEEALWHLGIRK